MKQLSLILLTAVFFAVVAFAAGIDGSWDMKFEIPDDTVENTLVLKSKGTTLIVVTEDGDQEVGTVKDGAFTYTMPKFYSDLAGYSADLTVKGKVDGDKMSGTWTWDSYDGTFTGTRGK